MLVELKKGAQEREGARRSERENERGRKRGKRGESRLCLRLILYFVFSSRALKVIYLGVNLVWQRGERCACVLYLQAEDESLRPVSQLHTRDRSFNPDARTESHTHTHTR